MIETITLTVVGILALVNFSSLWYNNHILRRDIELNRNEVEKNGQEVRKNRDNINLLIKKSKKNKGISSSI